MDADALAQVLRELPQRFHPDVLVGSATRDDAGVVRLRDDLAVVQTVDFFPPVVDDPRDYGSIAAANAMSDIYAMGAQPLCALAIGAFPEDLDRYIIAQILAGGDETAAAAGVAIVGGHTIRDDEPKYGLAVTGTIHPDAIVRNNSVRDGDVLVLTKPLGTGILTTAARRDRITADGLSYAVRCMKTLNDVASQTMVACEAHAATDVTGFGLLGHLDEMLAGRMGAMLDASALPTFGGVRNLAIGGTVPGGTRTNLATARARGLAAEEAEEADLLVLADAQTSGGLLISFAPPDAQRFIAEMQARGVDAWTIGRIEATLGVRVLGQIRSS